MATSLYAFSIKENRWFTGKELHNYLTEACSEGDDNGYKINYNDWFLSYIACNRYTPLMLWLEKSNHAPYRKVLAAISEFVWMTSDYSEPCNTLLSYMKAEMVKVKELYKETI